MDRGGTRGGLDQWNTSGSKGGLFPSTKTFATLADVLDDGSFHTKLDEIKREEPNDVLKE